jgi:hypothetical protein
MLGIVQSESHTTNKQLYAMTGAEPVSTKVRQRQLQFEAHCLRMPPNEPANIYTLYSSNNTSAQNKGKPKRSYVDPTALINLIEIIIKACSYIPRVETRLYSDSMASLILVN